jgi:hypothetical protein
LRHCDVCGTNTCAHARHYERTHASACHEHDDFTRHVGADAIADAVADADAAATDATANQRSHARCRANCCTHAAAITGRQHDRADACCNPQSDAGTCDSVAHTSTDARDWIAVRQLSVVRAVFGCDQRR